MDRKKIVNICLILVAIVLYLTLSRLVDLVFTQLDILVTRDYFLTVPEFVATGLSLVALLAVFKNAKARGFLEEATSELMKVTYPTPKESAQSAVVVVGMVAIATMAVKVFDLIWSYVTSLILMTHG